MPIRPRRSSCAWVVFGFNLLLLTHPAAGRLPVGPAPIDVPTSERAAVVEAEAVHSPDLRRLEGTATATVAATEGTTSLIVVAAATTATTTTTKVAWDSALNVPGPAWPAATAEQSNAAWPNGRQPKNMEAWPFDGAVSAQPEPCWQTSVAEDLAAGWPGQCAGLTTTQAADLEECATACKNNPLCSAWQYIQTEGCKNGQDSDFCAMPHGTMATEPAVALEGAQRIQHGSVRVMKDMTGIQIMNLKNLGSPPVQGADHCKRWCYSDLMCEYWLYDTQNGCWVNDPAYAVVQYPLVQSATAAVTSGDSADDIVAGEYIQHYCPDKPAESVLAANAATPAPSLAGAASDGKQDDEAKVFGLVAWHQLPYLIAAAMFVALLACMLCIAYDPGRPGCESGKKDPRRSNSGSAVEASSPKTRGVKYQGLMEDSMVLSEVDINEYRLGGRNSPKSPSSPSSPMVTLPRAANNGTGSFPMASFQQGQPYAPVPTAPLGQYPQQQAMYQQMPAGHPQSWVQSQVRSFR